MAFSLDTARPVFLLLFHAAARRCLCKLSVAARAQRRQLEHGADYDLHMAACFQQDLSMHCHYLLHLCWLCILYILCGLFAGFTDPVPAALAEWLACGVLGGTAVCAAQCFLSLVIRSFAVPIGMALAGGIGGLLFTAKGLYYLLPYSLLSMGMRANNPNLHVNLVQFAGCSVLFIVSFYLLSVWYIKCHDVRTQA